MANHPQGHGEHDDLWKPGCSAFWLEPKPNVMRGGLYPLPCIARRDLPFYKEGEWWHDDRRVTRFDVNKYRHGHTGSYKGGGTFFITDQDLGFASHGKPTGYLGQDYYNERFRNDTNVQKVACETTRRSPLQLSIRLSLRNCLRSARKWRHKRTDRKRSRLDGWSILPPPPQDG